MDILTTRERQIFTLLIQNYSTEEISHILGITSKTVRNHISNVLLKLGVRDRTQAVVELLKVQELSLSSEYKKS